MHAFYVDTPAGVNKLDVKYQYLGATGPMTGPVLITPTMLDLQWQSKVLYPAGHFNRDIIYEPSIKLPIGWSYCTSMDRGRLVPPTGDNTIVFPSLTVEALLDQPVMAGLYLKQVFLSESPVQVRLNVAAQSPEDLAGLAEAAKRFKASVPQTYKLFGSHHYDHYDYLVFLSVELSTYFGHHRSGEMALPAVYLKTAPKSTAEAADLTYLLHGFVHSWNGMYRRPAEMWTPNLNRRNATPCFGCSRG